jgi:hypothetical protein
MTLQDALAIYLYVWMTDKSLDEPVVEAAVEIIEREARKALAAHSQSDQPQSPNAAPDQRWCVAKSEAMFLRRRAFAADHRLSTG